MSLPTSPPAAARPADDRPAAVAARSRPPLWAWGLLLICAPSVAGYLCRDVFLFADDYLFLGQAKEQQGLSPGYLANGLFSHFSPVSRFVDYYLVGHLPDHPGLVFWTMFALVAATIWSSVLLMVALFGSSWLAFAASVLVGFSLTLLPLGNWWTAGVNILPAIGGSALALAGMVMLVRGRSQWWGLLSAIGYLVAVLDYESAMLTAGYIALWVLLFRARVTEQTLGHVFRRTWWTWALLFVIGAASALNYRLNYYPPSTAPPLADMLHGLYISLFRTIVPSALGMHEPQTQMTWFSDFGTIVGAVVLLATVIWTFRRRSSAWRGWLFALIGWLLPCAALLLNRPYDFAYNVIYVPLPSLFFIIGVFEAIAAAQRNPDKWDTTAGKKRSGRQVIMAVGALTVFAVMYAISAPATATGQVSFATDPRFKEFTTNAHRSADELRATVGDFSIIDSTVGEGAVPAGFAPFNRISRLFGIAGPTVPFGAQQGPYYQVDAEGHLVPVDVRWDYELTPTPEAMQNGLVFTDVSDLHFDPAQGACFTVSSPASEIVVDLPTTVTGDSLAVRVRATVESPTSMRTSVASGPDGGFSPANGDVHDWLPGGAAGGLDMVEQSEVSSVRIDTLTPGTSMCVSQVSLGSVVPL